MSTIQQDMTDAAAVWERLAKRLAEAHGDDSEEMWDQATQIHAAATIMHGFADKHKAKLRAAVDEDAPKIVGHVHPLDMGDIPEGAFVKDGASKYGRERCEDAPTCKHWADGWCYGDGVPLKCQLIPSEHYHCNQYT